MTDETRRNVHAERERQHREWAGEAIHPNAKKSHLEMADYHARAGTLEGNAGIVDPRMVGRAITSPWRADR